MCLQLSRVGGKELEMPTSSRSSVSSTADGIRSTGSSVEILFVNNLHF